MHYYYGRKFITYNTVVEKKQKNLLENKNYWERK